MDKTSTKDCQDFLNEKLNLNNSSWKRLSRKKVGEDWVRVFGCPVNNLQVDLIEGIEGLTIIKMTNTSPHAITLFSPPKEVEFGPPQKHLDNTINEIRKCFMESAWEDLFADYIELKGKGDGLSNEELKELKPLTIDVKVWDRLNVACQNLIDLDPQSTEKLFDVIDFNRFDFLACIAYRITEGLKSTSSIDELEVVDAIGDSFSYKVFGLSQMLDCLDKAIVYQDSKNIPMNSYHEYELNRMVTQCQNTINFACSNTEFLSLNYDKKKLQNLKALGLRSASYTYEAINIRLEKNRLEREINLLQSPALTSTQKL